MPGSCLSQYYIRLSSCLAVAVRPKMILADSPVVVQGTTLPSGTQFVPMIYAASDATTANLKTAKSYNTGIVLGFNEPNEANQADNTVAVGLVSSLGH